MKYLLISAILAGVSLVGLASVGCDKSRVAPPIHSNSRAVSDVVSVVHNGKKAQLKVYDYYNFDADKLTLNEVLILHDENSKPWLNFHIIIDMHHGIESYRIDLSEYQDNEWSYVTTIRNLTDSSMTGSINNFVKDKYGLGFE